MNKIVKKIAAVALSALLLTGTAAVPAFAAETECEQVAAQTVQVTAADIRSYGFAGAVQDALNDAQRIATDSSPVIVKVAPGSYDLYWCLFVYSNTTLDLTGVTLKRQFDGNMLRTGGNDSPGSGVTGYAHKNITLIGGTFDGNAGKNTILKAAHAKNFKMERLTGESPILSASSDEVILRFASITSTFTIIGITTHPPLLALPLQGLRHPCLSYIQEGSFQPS